MFNFFRKKGHTPSATARIFLHNTASNTKEEFVPLRTGRVGIYSCGPTVYDKQHIGNMRPYVVVDILKRVLIEGGYKVKHVINITDVGHLESDADEGEDKMELRARTSGEHARDIAASVSKAFFEDLRRLNISIYDTDFPRASEHIDEQIVFIKTLEEKGYTYTIQDGVYFDTAALPTYGALGNIPLDALKEGARVERNSEKRNPTDFALWKFSPKEIKREQEWNSPWGMGFPGWHIECSAMSQKLLGRRFDIHTGGVDHIPIHHNNEIAQSLAANGASPARYWLHNAHVSIEGRKISKSLGNTVYVRNIVDRSSQALAYRYWLLQGHYRKPLNFTWEAIEAADTALFRLHKFFAEKLSEVVPGKVHAVYHNRFLTAVRDDLDTPGALATLWELVRDRSVTPEEKRATLLLMDTILGLNLENRNRSIERIGTDAVADESVPEAVQTLLKARREARSNGNWEVADALRAEIEAAGYGVVDTKEGQKVKKADTHSRID